jgi:hypothetical protein
MADRNLAGKLALKGDWDLGENGWKADMDFNLLKLSVLTQGSVQDIVAAEPGAPAEGDIVILDDTHATHPNEIAVYDEGAWVYIAPWDGLLLWNEATSTYYSFTTADGWAELATGGGGGGSGSNTGYQYVRQGAFATIGAANPVDLTALDTVNYDYRVSIRLARPAGGVAADYLTLQFGDTVGGWQASTVFLTALGSNSANLTTAAGVTRIAQAQNNTTLNMGAEIDFMFGDEGKVVNVKASGYMWENLLKIDGTMAAVVGALRFKTVNQNWSGTYTLYRIPKTDAGAAAVAAVPALGVDPDSGAVYTKPLVADFPTAVNNDASYVWSDKLYGILVKGTNKAFMVTGRFRAKPVGNFDIYAKVDIGLMDQSNNNRVCIALRDSATGKLHGFGIENGAGGNHWGSIQRFNGDASFSSSTTYQGMETTEPWLRLNNDGVNLTLYWGDGHDWNQIAQVAVAAWLASFDQVGMLIQINNKSLVKLRSWSLVAPA